MMNSHLEHFSLLFFWFQHIFLTFSFALKKKTASCVFNVFLVCVNPRYVKSLRHKEGNSGKHTVREEFYLPNTLFNIWTLFLLCEHFVKNKSIIKSRFLVFSTRAPPESVPRLVPEAGSRFYIRVQHYRELLDSLPMDAYTHGCILHPEITVDSYIPAYAATSIRSKTVSDAEQLLQFHHAGLASMSYNL